jgi:hypothetical protein
LVNTKHGYAGKVDVIAKGPRGKRLILDYKTRKTKPGQACTPYDGQAMQIAAYAATAFPENSLPASAASTFTSARPSLAASRHTRIPA